jgi:pilus assembly protein Flp/PilA
MIQKLINFIKDEDGATAVEYGIMVAAIAAVIIGVVIVVGGKTKNAFEEINGSIDPIAGGS